ncbi:MAG: GPR endopeptidase [Firmicutes bacterium]|nr:GPR endopeptidase [Bacillota bacterium]
MRNFRSDLALESSALAGGIQVPGVRVEQLRLGDLTETVVEIVDERGMAALDKPCGRYVTLEANQMHLPEPALLDMTVDRLAETLKGMLPELGSVLVIGLGNRRITADSLGPRAVDGVLVTRHMRENTPVHVKGRLREVSAVAPGVLGVTGIETSEIARGIIEHTKPDAVIAVDALAAKETCRICTTMQITDTGIQPGSGVGNHRLGLSQETLGVPVIAVGVPMVVYAATIARDALELLIDDLEMDEEEHSDALDALVDRVVEKRLGDLVVAPREVDERVTHMAELLSLGINRALQQRLSKDEIPALMH